MENLERMETIEWIWLILGLLSIPVLVATNGLFVAAEFALVAVRRTRVEEMVHHGLMGAKAIQAAVTNLDRTIAATQLGITLASIALGAVGEPALAQLFEPAFDFLPTAWQSTAAHSVAAGIAFLLITFLHVVFGELIPKTIALQKPDGTALRVATPLNVFASVARPLIYAMNGTGNGLLRACGFPAATGREMVHSIEELSLLVEDTEEAGILGETQAEVVQKVFRLSGKRVRDCMIPRDKMAVLEVSTPPDKVLESVRLGAHTRMPVYHGDLDEVVGIVNTKDLFYLFSRQGAVILDDALYPARFLKPDEDVATALEVFRKAHRHMALVRGDDGKILGLITLEDILEEIVGEIEDEHDPPQPGLAARTTRQEPRREEANPKQHG
ncbi:MAG: hemolysin family protein [Planctomycetota bacterium]|nr:hemolysin family protein [Planctomycetota bacterium]